jgi:hypothetical protein
MVCRFGIAERDCGEEWRWEGQASILSGKLRVENMSN